jgi:hypothetical protein
MAIDAEQQVLEENPNFVSALRIMLLALGHRGRMDEAKRVAQRLRELTPAFTVSQYRSLSPMRSRAFRQRCAQIFVHAGIPK